MTIIHCKGIVFFTVLLAALVLPAQPAQGAQNEGGERPRSVNPVDSTPETPAKTGPVSVSPELSVLRLLRFSGTVQDALGRPRSGVVGLTFALYGEQEDGAPLWLETQNVELKADGRYTVLLGATSQEGLPLELFSNEEARWLGIQVQGEPEQPRVLLNFVAKFTAVETLGDSQIFDNGTNVGIGTTAPVDRLQVSGNIRLIGQTTHQIQMNGAVTAGRLGQDANGFFFASDTAGKSVRVLTKDGGLLAEHMRITGDGNVGIGTAAPANKLQIVGSSTGTILRASNDNAASEVGVILGQNTAGSGVTIGMEGSTSSPNGISILGTGNSSLAVWGLATANANGVGVRGDGSLRGGQFFSNGNADSIGVSGGVGTNVTGGVGVLGTANTGSSVGVRGDITTATGTAVEAKANSTSALLFRGESVSTERFRVDGSGNVRANAYQDLAGNPIISTTGANTTGTFSGTTSDHIVLVTQNGTGNGIEVNGAAGSSVAAVEATSTGNAGVGVKGSATVGSGIGVRGDGGFAGVRGGSTAASGIGVLGSATDAGGIAGQFENLAGGTILRGITTGSTVVFRVDGSGRVGIGTSSTDFKLTVKGTGNETYLVMSETGDETADHLKIQVAPGGGGASSRIGHLLGRFGNGFNVANLANAPLIFGVGAGPTERMRIDAEGDVGIGVSAVTPQLHVQNGDSGLLEPIAADGIFGECTGTNCFGVTGLSTGGVQGRGVHGESSTGTGVFGQSNSGRAGDFNRTDNSDAGEILVARNDGDIEFKVLGSGDVFADGAFTGGGADFAESIEPAGWKDEYEPGDLLVIDVSGDRRVALAQEPYSPLVAGIYSTKPGLLGREWEDEEAEVRLAQEIPMAIVGIVPCKVSAENGSIRRGDLLVTSSTPGHAMKGTERKRLLGAVVGKAFEPLASGTGIIQVLVTLQ